MRRLLLIILAITAMSAFANDGVYFTDGTFLVPVHDSTISVSKEILTITIGNNDLAKVDVYYEFYNPDSTKTVAMAFEAAAPYNAIYDISKNISHPYIHDFKVVMNGQKLEYRNALIVPQWQKGNTVIDKEDIISLDLADWKHGIPDGYYDSPNALYNARLDIVIYADYGYLFEAVFKPGINVVHHTYSYKMSYTIGYKYSIDYRLTPATRWANRQIDDFTLRIKNENDMDYYIGNDEVFSAAPFTFAGGGNAYPFVDEYGGHNTLVASHGEGAVLEWHVRNFAPQSDMYIVSIDNYLPSQSKYLSTWASKVVMTSDGGLYRFIGTSGDSYLVDAQDYGLVPKEGARVETFSAENGQGILIIKNREFKSVNIRRQPTTKSDVIGRIKDKRGELPVVLKCLGMAEERNVNGGLEYYWYKVEVNGKTGYVREDLMMWDAVDTY